MWWALLLLPGGLLLALGLGIAWAGLVLCWPGLRRMTAPMGGPVVAPEQPHGTAHEPSPPVVWIGTRTPWASYGDHATSTGRHWGEES